MSEGGKGSSSNFQHLIVHKGLQAYVTSLLEPPTKHQRIGDATPVMLALGHGSALILGDGTLVYTLGMTLTTAIHSPLCYSSQGFPRFIHVVAFKVLVEYFVGLGLYKMTESYGDKSKVQGKQLMKANYK